MANAYITMRSLLTITFGISLCGIVRGPSAIGQTVPRSSTQDRVAKAAVGATDSFPAAEYARLLNSPTDRGRDRGLKRMLARHADHPEVPRLLVEAVSSAIQSNSVTAATYRMIQTLIQYDQPEVRQAILGWLRATTAVTDVQEIAFQLMELAAEMEDSEVRDALVELLKHDDPRVVIVATDVLGQQHEVNALEPIRDLGQQPDYRAMYAYRFSVLNAMGQFNNRPATEFLISQLPALRGQLKFLVVDHLSRNTGQPFGGNAQQWKEWWANNRRQFKPSQVKTITNGDYAWDYVLPTFYSQKVYSTNLVFVIDISSTMRERTRRGLTRLERAKLELQGAIVGLPLDAAFNIIAFDDHLRLWQPQSVPATPPNKELAIHTIRGLANGYGTALYDGLDAAFQVDRELEAIFLLSDGLPTAGRIRDPAAILESITRRNRFRKVCINTIAVGRDSDLLDQLAALNFGTYRRTD
jgi:hypothetical protein